MGLGSVANHHMLVAAKIRTCRGDLVDISSAAASYVPELYDPDHRIVILGIRLVYVANPSNTAGSIIIGISTDTNALVESVATRNSGTAPLVDELTLASTLKNEAQALALGGAILPKGTHVIQTPSTGASNAGDFYPVYSFMRLDDDAVR